MMTTIFDVGFVHAAVAARDMVGLRAACDWACAFDWTVKWTETYCARRVKVIQALMSELKAAQGSAFSTATRQITLQDVDVITTLTPCSEKMRWYLPNSIENKKLICVGSVLHVLVCGIESDGDRTALAALGKWCWCHEHRSLCFEKQNTLHRVLDQPLVFACEYWYRFDMTRATDGSVLGRREYSMFLVWKMLLKKLLFWLEEGYMSDAECSVLCVKLGSLHSELDMHTASSAQDTLHISELLRRSWVAAGCNCWGPVRAAWIAAVVRRAEYS